MTEGRSETLHAHSTEYDRGEPCIWCGKDEDGGLDCTGPLDDPTECESDESVAAEMDEAAAHIGSSRGSDV